MTTLTETPVSLPSTARSSSVVLEAISLTKDRLRSCVLLTSQGPRLCRDEAGRIALAVAHLKQLEQRLESLPSEIDTVERDLKLLERELISARAKERLEASELEAVRARRRGESTTKPSRIQCPSWMSQDVAKGLVSKGIDPMQFKGS